MTSLQLADRYGRVATDLRVSLTDRCNLRCGYCMPVEGLPWLPKATLLTDDEVRRLITVAVTRLGVREVRFTGGEPLLRPGLDDIIAATSALGVGVSLTTNGVGLADRAVRLREAGLQRVNVSLDTLRRDRFAAIAHRDRLDDVLAGLAAARDAGLQPIRWIGWRRISEPSAHSTRPRAKRCGSVARRRSSALLLPRLTLPPVVPTRCSSTSTPSP